MFYTPVRLGLENLQDLEFYLMAGESPLYRYDCTGHKCKAVTYSPDDDLKLECIRCNAIFTVSAMPLKTHEE